MGWELRRLRVVNWVLLSPLWGGEMLTKRSIVVGTANTKQQLLITAALLPGTETLLSGTGNRQASEESVTTATTVTTTTTTTTTATTATTTTTTTTTIKWRLHSGIL